MTDSGDITTMDDQTGGHTIKGLRLLIALTAWSMFPDHYAPPPPKATDPRAAKAQLDELWEAYDTLLLRVSEQERPA